MRNWLGCYTWSVEKNVPEDGEELRIDPCRCGPYASDIRKNRTYQSKLFGYSAFRPSAIPSSLGTAHRGTPLVKESRHVGVNNRPRAHRQSRPTAAVVEFACQALMSTLRGERALTAAVLAAFAVVRDSPFTMISRRPKSNHPLVEEHRDIRRTASSDGVRRALLQLRQRARELFCRPA
jgi:hypothetical protein